MRRIFTLLLLLLLFSSPPVRAQGEPRLDSARVQIWPEYDEPGVLVIYQLLVSSQTFLPLTMTFRIPASAGEPHTVAVGQTLASVSDQDVQYFVQPSGDWFEVVVQVDGRAIQLEYYDPLLAKDGLNREFNYQWPGDYAVADFRVEFQQPFDASALRIEPSLPDQRAVPGGLTYHMGDFGALPAGESFFVNVTYQKASDNLSVSFVPVSPSAPVDENTPGRVSLETYLPWLVAAFGVLMIAGGLYYYFRGTPRSHPRPRHRASREEGGEGQTYCPQCGTRARTGDRFCRTCGARLRPGE